MRLARSVTTCSVAAPAGTITHATRGGRSALTKSSSVVVPVPPSLPIALTPAGSAAYPTISWPPLIRRRAMLAPIRPSPTIPSCMRSSNSRIRLPLSAVPRKSPVSTTPGIARITCSRAAGSSIGPTAQSKITLKLSVTNGRSSCILMVGLSSRSSSRRRQKGTANGKTSTGNGPRPPRISTSLSEVIRITCRAEAAATIRSRTSAPPWPLMRFSLPSTSSAPSIVSAMSASRPTRSMPSSRARRAVSSDVGTPRTLSPPRTRAPSARTNALAARPEPRPTTSPSLTKPRACVASAASGSLVVAAMVGHAPVSKDTAKANGAGTGLLAAHPDQLLEEAPQRRQVREQGLECVAVHGEQVDARAAPHRRGPRALAHERDLTEALARAERAQRDVSPAGHAPEHVHLALDDDVEPVAAIALAEDHLVGLEVLPADRERFVGLELDDVGRQQQVECPIRRHAELPVEAGKLHEVHGAPEPPRQEPGDLQAENLRDGRSVSERAHLAERVEREGLARRASDRGGDVRGEALRLANRVLSRRRARLSGPRVENPGAVADRPDPRVVRNLEMLVDDDPALL